MLAVNNNTEASILGRVFQEETTLTPEIARYLLSFKLPQEDEQRVNELSERARAGTLHESELIELDGYLHIGTLLAIMQSKARRFLRDVDQVTVTR